MEHIVDALAGRPNTGDVLEVHLLERDFVANVREIVEASGGEIVDPPHFVPLLHQRVGEG
jgi:hypothetical protein